MAGSASKYQKKFCEELISHMRGGNSFESFGALCGVSETTLKDWVKKHKDFEHAKEIGKSYERLYWENMMIKGANGALPNVVKKVSIFDKDRKLKQMTVIEEPGKFSASSVIFALKNKFPKQWRDTTDVNFTDRTGLEHLTDEQIEARKKLFDKILKR